MSKDIFNWIDKSKKANRLRDYLLSLNENQRISLYHLLYWKNHKEPIPSKEVELLISDGFLIENVIGLIWSESANKLDNLFKL